MTQTATRPPVPPSPPERLRRSNDFEGVMRRGRRVRGSHLYIVHRPNGLATSRVGFSVGRRVGGAVIRNRVKRRLRELIARCELTSGRDIVVVAQPSAADAPFEELGVELSAHLAAADLAAADLAAADLATAEASNLPDGRESSGTPARDSAVGISLPAGDPRPADGAATSQSLQARLVLAAIRGYQRVISPGQPAACRYEPTCSAYAATAIERHGASRGSWLAVKRLLRCRPGATGGYDPVPDAPAKPPPPGAGE